MDHQLREASGNLIEPEDTSPETRKDHKWDQGKGEHGYWGASASWSRGQVDRKDS